MSDEKRQSEGGWLVPWHCIGARVRLFPGRLVHWILWKCLHLSKRQGISRFLRWLRHELIDLWTLAIPHEDKEEVVWSYLGYYVLNLASYDHALGELP